METSPLRSRRPELARRRIGHAARQQFNSACLISSIKGEVKKKHISFGWNFSCFAAHLMERDRFCSSAPCARLRGHATPWVGFSLPAVFIASWQRSLSVPKPAKQNVVKFGDHSSIWDSWPIAFSGCPRGPRVAVRLRARGTQRLTTYLRLALEPECLENRTATARGIPRDGADSVRDTQAVCGFRC